MIGQINEHRIIRYFRLRPAFSWTLISFLFLFTSLFAVRWNPYEISDDDVNIEDFRLVKLAQLPKSVTKPDIDVSDEVTDKVVEQEEKEKPLQFGDDTGDFGDTFDIGVAPRIIADTLPQYPPSMRKAGVEGVVVILVGIDEQGKVVYGKIIRSLGKEFDFSVVRWIKKQKFHPALDKNMKPFRCKFNLPIRFKLED